MRGKLKRKKKTRNVNTPLVMEQSAIKTVDLQISQLIDDLTNGMSWYERDNTGKGSIQTKYGAKDFQIAMIQKHPQLQNLTLFRVIDDIKLSEEPVNPVRKSLDSEQDLTTKQTEPAAEKVNLSKQEELTSTLADFGA